MLFNARGKKGHFHVSEITPKACIEMHLLALLKKQKALKCNDLHVQDFYHVVWGGIEPPTQGFSVLCSTD
jgi:hypothetical protein